MKFTIIVAMVAACEARLLSPPQRATTVAAGTRMPACCHERAAEALPEKFIRVRGGAVSSEIMQTAKVGFLFSLWYGLNVIYNVVNKKVLNRLPLPWLVAVAQLGVGALYASAAWASGLREAPWRPEQGAGDSGGRGLGLGEYRALAPIGVAHGVGQVATVLSLGAGAVSFTHIVKALEPFFSAIVSAITGEGWLRPQVYATLLPVVGGVSVAVLKELSFSWLAFLTALGSNVAFAYRAVLSKRAMSISSSEGKGGEAVKAKRLSAASLYGVVTWLAFLLMLPLALVAEGRGAREAWRAALRAASAGQAAGQAAGWQLAQQVLLSGLFHYTNNEVMYLVLNNVHPITLAVGNTLKRVAIILAALLVFRNPITPAAAIGSAVGVAGVLLYSLTKQHYDNLDKKEK
eukprot:CAMPEP_0172614872 /NCGR_PEP_ID=MMETSP1068-20121228/55676_1 /TAXON_ID=35684 /ORGANISM="Pseudopedinella elastica, Strain CCMP716" /LENGTH=403 /DNA_ID=CAMNT_0013419823 /DNA_START=33 /DNA_END=1244 /DNA_ORIENTATION=+